MVKIKNKDWKDSIENHFKEAEVQNRGKSLESGDLIQYQNQVTKSKNKRFEFDNKQEVEGERTSSKVEGTSRKAGKDTTWMDR